jgi:hypothetical protein
MDILQIKHGYTGHYFHWVTHGRTDYYFRDKRGSFAHTYTISFGFGEELTEKQVNQLILLGYLEYVQSKPEYYFADLQSL